MKYKATITGLGECALDFLDECCNFIIIFNEDAPPELADISVLHTKSEVKEDPKKGIPFGSAVWNIQSPMLAGRL